MSLVVSVLAVLASPMVSQARAARQYIAGCIILNEKREVIRWFPGTYCLFMKDGSYLQYFLPKMTLSRIGPMGEVMWSRVIQVHHQMKLTRDGKRVVFLTSQCQKGELCNIRYDVFEMIDLKSGRTLRRWSTIDHKKELASIATRFVGRVTYFLTPQWMENLGCTCEFTHFNSIYEIPANPVASKIPAFRKGNFVINLGGLGGIGILDKDLKKLLWTTETESPHDSHDVQILESGDVLIYNNSSFRAADGSENFALREFNPVTGKTVWRYPKVPRKTSSSVSGGGVQFVDGGVLFSANSSDLGGIAYFADRDGKLKWSHPFPATNRDGTPYHFQEIKAVDLNDFLKNNRL